MSDTRASLWPHPEEDLPPEVVRALARRLRGVQLSAAEEALVWAVAPAFARERRLRRAIAEAEAERAEALALAEDTSAWLEEEVARREAARQDRRANARKGGLAAAPVRRAIWEPVLRALMVDRPDAPPGQLWRALQSRLKARLERAPSRATIYREVAAMRAHKVSHAIA